MCLLGEQWGPWVQSGCSAPRWVSLSHGGSFLREHCPVCSSGRSGTGTVTEQNSLQTGHSTSNTEGGFWPRRVWRPHLATLRAHPEQAIALFWMFHCSVCFWKRSSGSGQASPGPVLPLPVRSDPTRSRSSRETHRNQSDLLLPSFLCHGHMYVPSDQM